MSPPLFPESPITRLVSPTTGPASLWCHPLVPAVTLCGGGWRHPLIAGSVIPLSPASPTVGLASSLVSPPHPQHPPVSPASPLVPSITPLSPPPLHCHHIPPSDTLRGGEPVTPCHGGDTSLVSPGPSDTGTGGRGELHHQAGTGGGEATLHLGHREPAACPDHHPAAAGPAGQCPQIVPRCPQACSSSPHIPLLIRALLQPGFGCG